MIVWLGAVLAGVAIALLNREAWGWLPSLSRAVIWMETRLLPKQLRKLRQTEWLGELSAYDDRRLTGLLWTLRLLPVCVWTRATDPAGNTFVRFSLLLPLVVSIGAALILWPRQSPPGPLKEAHDIGPGGWIEQEFIATQSYTRRLGATIGLNSTMFSAKPGLLQMELLDENYRVLVHDDSVPIIDGGRVTVRFPPVVVKPQKRYRVRLVNTSGRTLGVYMRLAFSR